MTLTMLAAIPLPYKMPRYWRKKWQSQRTGWYVASLSIESLGDILEQNVTHQVTVTHLFDGGLAWQESLLKVQGEPDVVNASEEAWLAM